MAWPMIPKRGLSMISMRFSRSPSLTEVDITGLNEWLRIPNWCMFGARMGTNQIGIEKMNLTALVIRLNIVFVMNEGRGDSIFSFCRPYATRTEGACQRKATRWAATSGKLCWNKPGNPTARTIEIGSSQAEALARFDVHAIGQGNRIHLLVVDGFSQSVLLRWGSVESPRWGALRSMQVPG